MAKYLDQIDRRAFLAASGAFAGVSAMHLNVAEALALREQEGMRVAQAALAGAKKAGAWFALLKTAP